MRPLAGRRREGAGGRVSGEAGGQDKGGGETGGETGGYAAARRDMVAKIVREVEDTASWLGRSALAPRVLEAIGRVPRHRFVPEAERVWAYENRPMPIGWGQTISQPYIVAVMTELAAPGPEDRVLEVGTGCGYQAAVLAELARCVVTVECLPGLAAEARERLRALGYDNVEVHEGDGSRGWPAAAPYQAIVVTAAAEDRVPPALVEQLAPGGRLVIPVGPRRGGLRGVFGRLSGEDQQLLLLAKDEAGEVRQRSLLPVAFVPLIEGRARSAKA